ncbi:hypothetical protein GWK47_037686 [Chionoecetes opilio]|uniref:Uncharacterized protein n=1 Tax=Chionoecetes opilio TaxID=41210 RepID=A0A8J4YES6_CHIOP|nr:hypothetical protein GWK47_037686 [Chionoecetes opilio]
MMQVMRRLLRHPELTPATPEDADALLLEEMTSAITVGGRQPRPPQRDPPSLQWLPTCVLHLHWSSPELGAVCDDQRGNGPTQTSRPRFSPGARRHRASPAAPPPTLDKQGVCYIRLLCVPVVQKALDARFSRAEWDALLSAAALDAVGKLVLRECNQAMCLADFWGAVKSPGEPLRPGRRATGCYGGRHPAGRTTCPARNATCRACGRARYFEKAACRSTKKQMKTYAVTRAVIVEAHMTSQPRLQQNGPLGPGCCGHLNPGVHGGALTHIRPRHKLQSLQDTTVSIRHLAGGRLRVLGGSVLTFSWSGRSTQACLYFAEGVQHLYVLLRVCKALGLVPCDFPSVQATLI